MKNSEKTTKTGNPSLEIEGLVAISEGEAKQANGGWLGFFIENLCFGTGHFQGYDNRGNML